VCVCVYVCVCGGGGGGGHGEAGVVFGKSVYLTKGVVIAKEWWLRNGSGHQSVWGGML
jgi:hypothetical protein